MNEEKRCVLVLFSGGIDSTACIYYYLSQNYKVDALFIDYGQKARIKEKNSASNVVAYYGIPLNTLTFDFKHEFSEGEIKGRNAFFILSAILAYPHRKGLISMGIHSGVDYYDCSENFANDMAQIINGYTYGQLSLDFPFLKWSKKMIYTFSKDYNLPIHLTYSCENGTDIPCGKCLSCIDRGFPK